MTLSETALAYHRTARMTLVATDHDSFAPLLVLEVLQDDEEKRYLVVLGEVQGQLFEVAKTVIDEISERATITAAALHFDGYVKKFDTRDEVKEHKYGDVTKAFKDGDPQACEALTTLYMTQTETIHITQVYRWTPVDGWEFDEPDLETSVAYGQGKPWTLSTLMESKPNG